MVQKQSDKQNKGLNLQNKGTRQSPLQAKYVTTDKQNEKFETTYTIAAQMRRTEPTHHLCAKKPTKSSITYRHLSPPV
jgi:hypothetical protein